MHPIHSRRRFARKLTLALAVCVPVRLLANNADDKDSKKDDKDPKKAAPAEKVYEPGGDVKPPKLVHYVEPAFSSSSNEAFVDGTVKISAIVSDQGLPTELHIISGLNAQEDKTAIEAVKQWRFKPGTKAGEPVNVKVTVEVQFHLL